MSTPETPAGAEHRYWVLGLPDGSEKVLVRITLIDGVRTAFEAKLHDDAGDPYWVDWQIVLDSFPACACGGTGRVGPSIDYETGEWTKRGSLEPCEFCPNGAAWHDWLVKAGHKSVATMLKCPRPHPHKR